MSRILIIAEHDGSAINPSTAKTIACAAEIDGGEIDVAVFASDAASVAAEASKIDSVARILTIERPENEHALAECSRSSD